MAADPIVYRDTLSTLTGLSVSKSAVPTSEVLCRTPPHDPCGDQPVRSSRQIRISGRQHPMEWDFYALRSPASNAAMNC